MRKRSFIFIILLFVCISLSSCFQVLEEINLGNDGSGTMSITLNLSESKTKVASILSMKTFNGRKVPTKEEIRQSVDKIADDLKKTSGISNVKKSVDFTNYIVVISFKFNNLTAVNSFSEKILKVYKINVANAAQYTYSKASKTFSKTYRSHPETKKSYEKLNQTDKSVFENAEYTSIYRFASTVKNQTNKKAKLSVSGKAIMQKTSVQDILHTQVNISNTIQLN